MSMFRPRPASMRSTSNNRSRFTCLKQSSSGKNFPTFQNLRPPHRSLECTWTKVASRLQWPSTRCRLTHWALAAGIWRPLFRPARADRLQRLLRGGKARFSLRRLSRLIRRVHRFRLRGWAHPASVVTSTWPAAMSAFLRNRSKALLALNNQPIRSCITLERVWRNAQVLKAQFRAQICYRGALHFRPRTQIVGKSQIWNLAEVGQVPRPRPTEGSSCLTTARREPCSGLLWAGKQCKR